MSYQGDYQHSLLLSDGESFVFTNLHDLVEGYKIDFSLVGTYDSHVYYPIDPETGYMVNNLEVPIDFNGGKKTVEVSVRYTNNDLKITTEGHPDPVTLDIIIQNHGTSSRTLRSGETQNISSLYYIDSENKYYKLKFGPDFNKRYYPIDPETGHVVKILEIPIDFDGGRNKIRLFISYKLYTSNLTISTSGSPQDTQARITLCEMSSGECRHTFTSSNTLTFTRLFPGEYKVSFVGPSVAIRYDEDNHCWIYRNYSADPITFQLEPGIDKEISQSYTWEQECK